MPLPDGPTSPVILQMLQWITTPFSFMRSCKHHYGDRFTVTFNQKFGPLVFFSNPEALKVILTGDVPSCSMRLVSSMRRSNLSWEHNL
jgi:hypothetical protein